MLMRQKELLLGMDDLLRAKGVREGQLVQQKIGKQRGLGLPAWRTFRP
jgi:hypothetical protein